MGKTPLITVHLLLYLLSYTAWIWLDYRIIAIVAVLHLIMLEVMGGCPLSHAQFKKDKNMRFYEWWMHKMGVQFTDKNRYKVRIFMQYIVPAIIIGLGFTAQTLLGVKPLVVLI